MIFATCLTIAAALASAPGGSVIALSGDCPAVTIKRVYSPLITVEASAATVRGLIITGGGIVWRGGTIAASGGIDGFASAGYGAWLKGRDIALENVRVTDAKKGIAIDGARNVAIRFADFTGLREDGVIANATIGLTITGSRFRDFRALPSRCTTAGKVAEGIASRVCLAGGGVFVDGNHSDAIQYRNGTTDALLGWNSVENVQQGIGQMDGPGDKPCERIVTIGNTVAVYGGHSITLNDCRDCVIRDNVVSSSDPARRTALRPGTQPVAACGNSLTTAGKTAAIDKGC